MIVSKSYMFSSRQTNKEPPFLASIQFKFALSCVCVCVCVFFFVCLCVSVPS